MVREQNPNDNQRDGNFVDEQGFRSVDANGYMTGNGQAQNVPAQDVEVDVSDNTKDVLVLLQNAKHVQNTVSIQNQT